MVPELLKSPLKLRPWLPSLPKSIASTCFGSIFRSPRLLLLSIRIGVFVELLPPAPVLLLVLLALVVVVPLSAACAASGINCQPQSVRESSIAVEEFLFLKIYTWLMKTADKETMIEPEELVGTRFQDSRLKVLSGSIYSKYCVALSCFLLQKGRMA